MGDRTIRFDGQVAVVTGAGRGLGAAYARLLAERGASVVVHDAGVNMDGTGSDPGVAQTVVDAIRAGEGTAEPCVENLMDPSACRRVIELAVDRFGRLDVLINNAGILAWHDLEETADDLWHRMVAVGVTAPFLLARAAFPMMKGQRYGRIVFTTSGRAMYVDAGLPGLSAYSAAKGAQLGLTVALAVEGERHGIRVNAVSPVAATRMLHREVEPGELAPELVAPGVAYLASSACEQSGVVLRASGGRFSVAGFTSGEGVRFGPDPPTIEDVASRWGEIVGTSR